MSLRTIEWLPPLVVLILAALLGFLDENFTNGMIAFVSGEVLWLHISVSLLDRKEAANYEILNNIQQSLLTFGDLKPVVEKFGVSNEVQGSMSGESNQNVLDFWVACMKNARAHWFVVSYALPNETWRLIWAKTSHAVQAERIADGCKITRVFVVESEKEMDELKATMIQQKYVNGVDVRWIFKSELDKDKEALGSIEVLKSLDVAIVDGRWLYATILSDRRELKRAYASLDPIKLGEAKILTREAYGLANVFDPNHNLDPSSSKHQTRSRVK